MDRRPANILLHTPVGDRWKFFSVGGCKGSECFMGLHMGKSHNTWARGISVVRHVEFRLI